MFGSATELVTEHFESEEMRTSVAMLAANGNFAGPGTPGSAYQLMHRALYRGSSAVRGRPQMKATADFNARAPIGGMGAITTAMAHSIVALGGAVRTAAEVVAIKTGRQGVEGVVLGSGEEIDAPVVVSALNPKKTMTELVPTEALPPELRAAYANIEMAGCLGKVHLALDAPPRFACAHTKSENELLMRCGFRVGSSVEAMQQAYESARRGDWSGEPIIYGLTQTTFDPTLAPHGKHLMSLSVTYAPYHLSHGTWLTEGDAWAKHVIRHLGEHITNLADSILDYAFLTPADLEEEFGLLEGNALHGDVSVARMFNWRPLAGYSDYTTPVPGLYICSNGSWPANYVTGLPGHNAANKIVADLRACQAGRDRQDVSAASPVLPGSNGGNA
jgi:phytoene dehydrogenase-like protein